MWLNKQESNTFSWLNGRRKCYLHLNSRS